MHFAFAIVSLFPGGGLQRDCVDIARSIRELGHEVTIFTSRKFGGRFAEDLSVSVLSVGGRTNHWRQRAFADQFRRRAAEEFDLLVGFDKLIGLDVLYCSERSMRARLIKVPILHLVPRYSEFVGLEKECFAPNRATKVLLLSEAQRHEYWDLWTTEPNRLIMLPPTLTATRRRPEYRTNAKRGEYRAHLGLATDDWAWIAVGVQPKTKGFDRSIRALSRFADAQLLIVGLAERDAKSAWIKSLARWLGVADKIKWLGHREDVPELMAAADVLVHPARYDTTGTVILEAVANGLPVITTSGCGYAKHVTCADAGIVVQEPFNQAALVDALKAARDPSWIKRWSKAGSEYGKQNWLCEGKGRAAELIVARALESSQAPAKARCH